MLMEKVFEKLPKLKLNSRKLQLFLNGVMLTYNVEDGVYNIYDEKDKYIGTGTVRGDLLKRDIIIQSWHNLTKSDKIYLWGIFLKKGYSLWI